jgi:hypothetical protein
MIRRMGAAVHGWTMRPLTFDDLLPLEEYASRRREFFDSLRRYLDRYRRARIGPRVTLLFENRQTLWFRVQEIVRVARLAEPQHVQAELDLYNRLLPGRDVLQAAMLIDVLDESRLTEELAPWRDFTGHDLVLRIGQNSFPSTLRTCRPEDRCIGAAHWVQFTIPSPQRKLLTDFRQSAVLEMTLPEYHHHSLPLSEDVRQSLTEDLQLSERDAAA